MIDLCLVRTFLAAELFKLHRSRLARVVFGTMCVAPVIPIGTVWAFGSTASVFPEVVHIVGASFWLLAGLTSLLLIAGSLGNEYELGTTYAAVGRGTPRWLFVAGKAIVVLGAATINSLVAWLCSGLMAVVSHLVQVGTAGLGDGIRTLLTSGLLAVGIAVLSAASYIGLVTAIGVLARSTAFTMFGGLGLFMIDFFVGEFTPVPGLQDSSLGVFSILSNTNLLLNRLSTAMGATWSATGGTGTSPGTAVLVMACYAIGGIVLACALFQRQDLRGRS